MKQYRQAIGDFDKAISLDGHKLIAYVGKGDCLRLLERYEDAKHFYTVAYNSKKSNISLLLRRAICNMEMKRFEAALDDINKLLESDPENSEAFYFKGLIFGKLSTYNVIQDNQMTPLFVMNRQSSTIQTREQSREPFMKSLRSKYKTEITMKLFSLWNGRSTSTSMKRW